MELSKGYVGKTEGREGGAELRKKVETMLLSMFQVAKEESSLIYSPHTSTKTIRIFNIQEKNFAEL